MWGLGDAGEFISLVLMILAGVVTKRTSDYGAQEGIVVVRD